MAPTRAIGSSIVIGLLAAAAWAQGTKPLDLSLPRGREGGAEPAVLCLECGEVSSVREVSASKRASSEPAAARAGRSATQSGVSGSVPVGAVVFLPLGGSQDEEGFRFGAVGTAEMQARLAESSYEIVVRMDSGERRILQRRDGARFSVGQRVAVRDGLLEPL